MNSPFVRGGARVTSQRGEKESFFVNSANGILKTDPGRGFFVGKKRILQEEYFLGWENS